MAFRGQQGPGDGNSSFNAMAFLVRQLLGRTNTATLVKVVGVRNAGEVAMVGFVDIHPMVNQMDGNNNATPHGTIYNVPYMRIQGGANAIIIDPEVGDIGMAAFADHDINSVKANKADANPGSSRRFSMADAMYFGGFLNAIPTQYISFSSTGIKIHSPTKVILEAPDILLSAEMVEINATTSVHATTPIFTIDGNLIVNGNTSLNGGITQGPGGSGGAVSLIGPATVTNDVIAGGKSLETHDHNVPGVEIGGSTVVSDGPN